jgi:hypothetical protein
MLKRLIFCLWILLPFFLFAQNSAVKMEYRNARRCSDIPKFKIILNHPALHAAHGIFWFLC